jgi:hypothetical protein
VRGDFLRKGEGVESATLAVLHPLRARSAKPDRLDLARWLFDPANPLTGRVAVNHVWKHLFGRGLVATVDDFGTRGEKPSHPELLDWLATEYARLGWSRKEFIKLIVTSATYRQSSEVRPELSQRDPLNILLARQNRLRLEAEVIRDCHLAVSGLLNAEIGGPSVRPPLALRFDLDRLREPDPMEEQRRHRALSARFVYILSEDRSVSHADDV